MDWLSIVQALGITLPGIAALIWQIIRWRKEREQIDVEIEKTDSEIAKELIGGAKTVVDLYKELEVPLRKRIADLEKEVKMLKDEVKNLREANMRRKVECISLEEKSKILLARVTALEEQILGLGHVPTEALEKEVKDIVDSLGLDNSE